MMIQKQSFGAKGIYELENVMDTSSLSNQQNQLIFSTRKISDHLQTCIPLSMPTAEECQRARRNQEQNDQLQIKADELEKLFAEHKHRSSGGRSDPLSRSNSPHIHIEQETMLVHRKEGAEMAPDKLSDTNTVTASVGSLENSFSTQNSGNALKMLPELSVSEESRGKFYSSYKQMRDAKLREEWDAKRAEKEATIKAMHENFARSKAEMAARFSGSGEAKHCSSDGLRCRELPKSPGFGTNLMTEEALPLEDLPDDDDKEFEFPEEITQQHRIVDEEPSGDGISSRNQVQKLKTIKTLSLDCPKTSTLPISLSLVKSLIPVTRKQEAQPRLVAKSVPKLSYVGKRNNKPSSQVTKTTSHPQLTNYARSKRCDGGTPSTSKNRPEYLPLKRSSTIHVQLKEFSSRPQFDGKQFNGNVNNRFSKNMEINPSIRTSKRADPSFEANLVKSEARESNAVDSDSEANIGKWNAAVASAPQDNKEKCDELAFLHENSTEIAKEEEEEELENMEFDDFIEMSSEELRMIPNCDKFGISSSQDNEEPASTPHLHSVLPLEESSDIIPIIRDSECNPFSACSPLQSPESCDSQTKMETAAGKQTRKEQEKSHKPLPGARSSHNKSAKRIAKGFKKLLKFGKSKGSEIHSDRVSVTTSEGISPTEQEKNPSNRLSNDLKKSRMVFQKQTSTSDSCIIKSGLYHERDRMFSCIPGAPANFKLADYQRSRSSPKGFMCFARIWKNAKASVPLESSPR